MAMDNQTSLQVTFQPSAKSNDNSTKTQKKQNLNESQKISKHRRDIEKDINREYKVDIVWEAAQNNEWYKWATFTARELGMDNCLLCSKSPLSKITIVPSPHDYYKCAQFNQNFCGLEKERRPYCPAECLGLLGNSELKDRFYWGHFGSWCQYWDVNKNIKVEKGKIEIPEWYSIDYTQKYECYTKLYGTIDLGNFTGKCSITWILNKPTIRFPRSIKRSSMILAQGIKEGGEMLIEEECENQTIAAPAMEIYEDQTIVLADFFWFCGKGRLMASLPLQWKGTCTRVRLIQEITLAPWNFEKNIEKTKDRAKRAYTPDPEVYLDVIGQPRGIPNQFKARDEVASGFESIFVWITQNKNTEWINYIYYNQQRFINYTDDALTALGEQVDATSKMTWQNRQALNWLLADKGGVCVLFGDQCCTFIPNHTAPDGAFTEAMHKLKRLRMETAANAGRDNLSWDWFDLQLGKWGAWFAKLGIFLGVAVLIGGLLFCCVLPLLKSLIVKATVKQMGMTKYQDNSLIQVGNYKVHPNWVLQTLEDSDNQDNV